MQHRRSNGQRVGNVAYGYRSSADGKHVEVEPTEQEALAIRCLRQQGRSLREIAATLNGQGIAHAARRELAARSRTPHCQERVGFWIAEFSAGAHGFRNRNPVTSSIDRNCGHFCGLATNRPTWIRKRYAVRSE